MCAAIAPLPIQEPTRLLQHLFYFIAHETISLDSADWQCVADGLLADRNTERMCQSLSLQERKQKSNSDNATHQSLLITGDTINTVYTVYMCE